VTATNHGVAFWGAGNIPKLDCGDHARLQHIEIQETVF
jgi:hypothetical protein